MTQTQPIVDPPPPRPFFVAVVANAIALILLVMGFIKVGIGFVALALAAGLAGIFQSRSGPGAASSSVDKSTGTGGPAARG